MSSRLLLLDTEVAKLSSNLINIANSNEHSNSTPKIGKEYKRYPNYAKGFEKRSQDDSWKRPTSGL